MKRIIMLSAVLLLVILINPECAFSQDEMKAKKYENPKWVRVVKIDYKSGKYNRAREIIDNYYVKANEKSGVKGPSMVVELHTGGWDIMAVWEMDEGIESILKKFREINLTSEQFHSSNYYRLQTMEKLYQQKKINSELYWVL